MQGNEWPADSIEAGISQCVAACDAVVKVSEDCADACLALEGNGKVTACFLADLDCIEVSITTTRVLSWHTRNDGPTAVAILEACREACRASITACEHMKVLHPSWQTCTMACRRLSDSCTRLLDLLAHHHG